MKKIFLTLSAALLICSVHSQGVTAGLKAGVNSTNFTGDFETDKKSLSGFHAGGFVNIRLGGISVQPELLVSTAGAKIGEGESDYRLTYLAMPVMLKIRL